MKKRKKKRKRKTDLVLVEFSQLVRYLEDCYLPLGQTGSRGEKRRNRHITHTSSPSLSRRRRLLFPVTPAVTAPASLAVHGVLPLVAPPGRRGLGQGAGPARGAGVPVRRLMDGRGLGLPPRGLGSLGVPRAPCWLTPPRDPGAFGERSLRGGSNKVNKVRCLVSLHVLKKKEKENRKRKEKGSALVKFKILPAEIVI